LAAIDVSPPATHRSTSSNKSLGRRLRGYNWFGGTFGWIWLVIVMVPIYWIVITSFKEQSN
jgi:raffinose/stachyose/melibiose transport system permease protein